MNIKRLNKIRTEYVWADIHKCKACWECLAICQYNVIGKVGFFWHKHIVIKNAENCTGCKKCIKTCPEGVFSEKIPNFFQSILSKKWIGFGEKNIMDDLDI